MDVETRVGNSFNRTWNQFVKSEQLSKKQEKQFFRYMAMLIKATERVNLTTITSPKNIVERHFRDSLQLSKAIDLKPLKAIGDIGTGGGFPDIPLSILFPHLQVVLIEVNNKKIRFLHEVIKELELTHCEVCPLDWRTFLRKTDYELDLFCARASLQPEELIRMFKPGCFYKHAQLVYWALKTWVPSKKVKPFVNYEYPYRIGKRDRKLVFFGLLAS